MNDEYEDMQTFFTDSSNYLESLVRCRAHLKDAPKLAQMLDETLEVELELALIGAKKARSVVLKEQAKDNVVSIGKK